MFPDTSSSSVFLTFFFAIANLIFIYLLGSLGIVDGDDVELGDLHHQVTVWDALYFVYVYVVVVMYVTATGTLPPMVGTYRVDY